MMYFSKEYMILVGIPMLFAIIVQLWMKSRFSKYTRIVNSAGVTGAEAAHAMLDRAGLTGKVGIERIESALGDHYDPKAKVLRLSPEVYSGKSIASVAVACHEAGHALQDAEGYEPLQIRNAVVPTAAFGSNAAFFLIFLGLAFRPFAFLVPAAIILFAVVVFFQLVNLPVEFNASARAKIKLREMGFVRGGQEAAGVATMLNAAAMTYVAATVAAIGQFLYYVLLANNRR